MKGSRWLKSRVMVFGMVLLAATYVPAIIPNANQAAWIAGFFVLAPVVFGGIAGNNVVQSWRGSYQPTPEDEFGD